MRPVHPAPPADRKLRPGIEPTDALVEELLDHCRQHFSLFKCPRSLDIHDELPRLPTGKLDKQQLRRAYVDSVPD